MHEYSSGLQEDEFNDWLNTIESIFKYKDVPDDKKVKLVAQGRASAGWEQLKKTCE